MQVMAKRQAKSFIAWANTSILIPSGTSYTTYSDVFDISKYIYIILLFTTSGRVGTGIINYILQVEDDLGNWYDTTVTGTINTNSSSTRLSTIPFKRVRMKYVVTGSSGDGFTTFVNEILAKS